MTVETATYINSLSATLPAHTDGFSETDAHIRLIKSTLQATFPNLSGAVTLTQAQINALTNAVLTTGGQTVSGTTTFANLSVTASLSSGTLSVGTTGTFGGTVTAANFSTAGAVSAGSVTATGYVNASTKIRENGDPLIPAGVIVMWSGSVVSVPAGWQLCNGAAGTPDLRDKFIVGAGLNYSPAATGGSSTVTLATANLPAHNHPITDPGHTHTLTDPGHTHVLTDPGHRHNATGGTSTPAFGSLQDTTTGGTNAYPTSLSTTGITQASATTGISAGSATTGISTGNTGSGTAVTILPPYYALCYIMKL